MNEKYKMYVKISIFLFGIFGTIILYLLMNPPMIFLDSTVYIKLAENIQEGRLHVYYRNGYMMSFPPFYSMLISLLEKITHNFEHAGAMISIIAGSLATIPAILLAKRFYGLGVASLALVLFMFNLFYILYSSAIFTEALFTFLFLSAIYVIYLALSKNSLLMWFSAGAIGGAAWLTRDVGIIIPAASIFWLTVCLLKKQYTVKKFVFFGAALIIGLLITYLPIRSLTHLDKQNTPNLYPPLSVARQLAIPDQRNAIQREIYRRELTDDGKEYKHIAWLKTSLGLSDLITDWRWILKRILINIIGIIKSTALIFFYIFFIFIIIGIFISKNRKNSESEKFFLRPHQEYLFISSFVLLFASFYALAGGFSGPQDPERYLVPIIPILSMWCALGIIWTVKKISEMTVKKIETLTIAVLGSILLMINIMYIISICNWYFPFHNNIHFAALAQLNIFKERQSQNNLVIMSKSAFLPYYADALQILTPYGEYGEIIKFAKSKKVDYFFLENSLYAPQLEFLKNTKISTPELKFILQIKQGNLYQLIY